MNDEPYVSIILPAFNVERYIASAIFSVLSQDYENFELIVINDGSTDRTALAVKEIARKDYRVKLYNQKNHGFVYSVNRGLKLAKYDLIARIDGDDEWMPHKLRKQVEIMANNPRAVLIGGSCEIISPDSLHTSLIAKQTRSSDIKRAMTITNDIIQAAALFRKDILNGLGGFNQDYYPAEDYDLISRMMDEGSFILLPLPIYRYRIGHSSISSDNNEEQNEIIKQIADRNWQKSSPKLYTINDIVNGCKYYSTINTSPKFSKKLVDNFLYINMKIGFKMIRFGQKTKGLKQIINVAIAHPSGFKQVCKHVIFLIKDRIRNHNE